MGPGAVLEAISEPAKAYAGPHGHNIFVEQPTTHIGRNPAQLPDHINLPVGWVQVSAKHCRIMLVEGKYTITDTSSNGTFVSGQRLQKNVAHPLNFGDKVGLATNAVAGAFEYIFRLLTAEEEAAARKRKAATAFKAPAKLCAGSHPSPKKAKLSPPGEGARPSHGAPGERASPAPGLAEALVELQKKNEVERARRTEEQAKREEAERKLQQAQALHAAELKAVEEEGARRAAQACEPLAQEVERLKSQLQEQQDAVAAREAELSGSRERVHKLELETARREGEMKSLQDSLDKHAAEEKRQASELDTLQAQRTALEEQVAERDAQLVELAKKQQALSDNLEVQRGTATSLRDEVIKLKAEVQVKERAEQRARDAEAGAGEALKVKLTLAQSAASDYVALEEWFQADMPHLHLAHQALGRMLAHREDSTAVRKGLCRSLALVSDQELQLPRSLHSTDQTQLAGRGTDDASMVTQGCGPDEEEGTMANSRLSAGTKSPQRPAAALQPTQQTPSGSLALAPTLQQEGVPKETPHFGVPPRTHPSAAPAPPCQPDNKQGMALGAQPHSISLAFESAEQADLSASPRHEEDAAPRGTDDAMADDGEDEDVRRHGEASPFVSDSQVSSDRRSGMASGDENVDVSNSLGFGGSHGNQPQGSAKFGTQESPAKKGKAPVWAPVWDRHQTVQEASELAGLE